jgi:hypothetical protein
MRPDIDDPRLDARLAALPTIAPDPSHAERVRARCRAELVQRVSRAQARQRRVQRAIAPVLVGSVCFVYFALVLANAFAWRS